MREMPSIAYFMREIPSMASFLGGIPSMATIFSVYATIFSVVMLIRTIGNELIPKSLRDYMTSKLCAAFHFNSGLTFIVDQRWEAVTNQTYRAAEVYLPTIAGPSTNCLLVGSNDTFTSTLPPKLSIPVGAKVIDTFQGMRFEWTLCRHTESKNLYYERKYFQLTCKDTNRDTVLQRYIPHVSRMAESILCNQENLFIYTYNQEHGFWESTIFKQPSTFETLVMEKAIKKHLQQSLDWFVKKKANFNSVGKAWNQGYLLYGPPGTGKSSLVAAMANYLKYNIYDLQFSIVKSDTDLRHILTSTTNRSIILIEDIDCISKDRRLNSEQEEDDKIYMDTGATLPGLLNFIDGIWSSCMEERIIICTANHKDKLDPALLRAGRMDVHLKMEYCNFEGFKMLAETYLGIKDHLSFMFIEEGIKEVDVTPAEVAQQLMKDKDPMISLNGVISLLKREGVGERERDEDEIMEVEDDASKESSIIAGIIT